MPVGVFDSGLGGLTVFRAIRAAMPEMPLCYYSDNAHAPYGDRNDTEIIALTTTATEQLWSQGCELVVLACNTASAIALRPIQSQALPAGRYALGVFVPLIEALTERAWADCSPARPVSVQQLALFATPATVKSRAFQRELAVRAIGVDVEAQPCDALVDALERGQQQRAEMLVDDYVKALHSRMPSPQVAVLGCTHYPLLQDYFQRALGAGVPILNQPELVARSLKSYLRRHPNRVSCEGERQRYFCSGDVLSTSRRVSEMLQQPVKFERLPFTD
ncbi:MAG: glutamate racemase [Granulosicoccaceae bacterium]